MQYLDFEKPIFEVLEKIEALSSVDESRALEQIKKLKDKSKKLTKTIFSSLTDWQIIQLARHPMRPYSLDYIDLVFEDFDELHGDRAFADDAAIVAGLARLENIPVMVIGQQKGRTTKEKLHRNFAMVHPEGYRKALRLMKMAERFGLPIITLIDTPGAYPGVNAESRGQSEAIARNLREMSMLKVPIICVVIGEGCSGGALGIGVGDSLMMLQYSYFATISPEGCASILWRSADKASLAASVMGITATKLKKQKIIDKIIPEPVGGAHRDYKTAANNIKKYLLEEFANLKNKNIEELLDARYHKLMKIGAVKVSS